LSSSISGASVIYAGGGRGGDYYNGTNGVAGSANTGNGGGGGTGNLGGTWTARGSGGTGDSGIVIIRYPNANPDATATGAFTKTTAGGYKIYIFTGNGTFTPN
jgi:hypothetical protein